jgi:hypothetical protein
MITLLTPLGLTAFAAVALPFAIHWMRRSDRRIISFAAMRYLREYPHSRAELRLHERWLLLMRIFLIACLALWLSWPVWRGRSEPQSPWVLVAPGIDAAAARNSVDAPGAEWHWLAPEFPALDTTPIAEAASPSAALSSLVREVDSDLAPGTAITLVVPTDLGGLDAERLQLAHPMTWRVLPGASPEVMPRLPPMHTLAVRYDPKDLTELPLVRALASAWQADDAAWQIDIATQDSPLPASPSWLIWLGAPAPNSVTEWVRQGGSLLISRQPAAAGQIALVDDNGAPVMREQVLGAGRVLSLAVPLRADDATVLRTPEFPRTLSALMQGPTPSPNRAPAVSVAPLQLPSPPHLLSRPQSLESYLAILIAVVFLFERIYATRVRKSASPSAAVEVRT